MKNKHEFALYYPHLMRHNPQIGALFRIEDIDVVHRIARVLRLKEGDECVLFDAQKHVRISLAPIQSKKHIECTVLALGQNKQIAPRITALLPLLKRDDFQDVIYGLAELGVQDIQLITTSKTMRKWGGAKELERIERIVIAAAEQSKNFIVPNIHAPQALNDILSAASDMQGVLFHPTGQPLFDACSQLREKKTSHIAVLVGPEGDLTVQEQQLVKDAGFAVTALTPTVLRAQHAMMIGVGALRSML